MNRSFRTRYPLLLALALLTSGALVADTIELKSGEKIECRILSETDTTITYEYNLTANIKDSKTIQKSDVAKLTRLTPAQLEWKDKGLGSILPTADLLSASDYESIIQDKLRTFVAKYPGTPEEKEAKDIINTLSEEKGKVLAGGLKVDGKWLDEAQVKKEQYNIDAYRLRRGMKQALANTRPDPNVPNELAALREFEALRTSFPASMQYLNAIPEAIETLEAFNKRLTAMALEYPVLKVDREKITKSQGQENAVAREAILAEERNFKALRDAEVKKREKWLVVYKYDMKTIQDAQKLVAKELQTLRNINLPALQNEIENLNTAIGALAESNATAADEALNHLRPNKNNLINKKAYDDAEKKLKELQTKLAAEMKASKTGAGAAAGTPGAESGPEAANPIAEAMRKKEEAKKKDEEAKRKAKAEADAKAAAAKPAAQAEEEQTLLEKINEYIPFIGGGLLVLLILAMVLGKKKKDDDE